MSIMSTTYTRLVLVEFAKGGKRYIYEAPPWPIPSVSTRFACVETCRDGFVTAKVVGTILVNPEAAPEELAFILACTGAKLPLKRIVGFVDEDACRDEGFYDWDKEGTEDGAE